MNSRGTLLLLSLMLSTVVPAQQLPFVQYPNQLDEEQFAWWIAPTSGAGEGVFYFRKHFQLESVPDSFPVYVSADNRYRLFVNGNLVCWGPAVGDLYHWNYETIDLGPWLKPGENLLAAQVWNQGPIRGARQISEQTAWILQGPPGWERQIHTDRTWRVFKERGIQFIRMTDSIAGGGYIAGASEEMNGSFCSWGWQQNDFDDSSWDFATEIGKGNHSGLDTWKGTSWLLQPRSIPMMEVRPERSPDVIDIDGPFKASDQSFPLTIPGRSKVEVLMDQRVLTMGFPRLDVSGGAGSRITLRYQESLFDQQGRKGDRDEWRGKSMKGVYDVFLPDGRSCRFEPLWIRVFRYVKLTVATEDDPLTILNFSHLFTTYPFKEKGSFQSSETSLDSIWEASWRTARLCALETYMDCPYYEQLQYIGDTRIQALISYYVTGDDRLARNALQQFYQSMQPMGLTQSRYPAQGRQIIPPFSLYYISMLHDYFMFSGDSSLILQYIPGIRFILDWFTGRIGDSGLLGPLPFWNHIDGGTGFINGSPPGISEGGSAHMSLLLAYTLDRAAYLMDECGKVPEASEYRTLSAFLKEGVRQKCYNEEKGLVAETPAQKVFSQHTNSFAILAGLFDEQHARIVAQKVMDDPELIQATLYFRFYVFQALKRCGMGGEMLDLLDPWEECLDMGLTTFPEHGIESRSDCHAWSAHLLYDLLNITCGVEPSAPGFRHVLIAPQPGNLTWFRGTVPHPLGEIRIEMTKTLSGRHFGVWMPEGVQGTFRYDSVTRELDGGYSEINLP